MNAHLKHFDAAYYADFLRDADSNISSFLEIGTPGQMARSEETTPSEVILQDMPLAVKDNIAVSGYRLTCGSRMLEHLVSPYDATAVERLRGSGVRIVGKTNLDEFGMGSSTDTSALGQTNNPWDHTRVSGGSSGGSAAAVAQQLVPAALGSDTGGSIRQPAAFCGIYGLKPTYGTVSRYGLVAYASSLEVIGVLGRDVDTVAAVYRQMSGADSKDQSSVDIPKEVNTSPPETSTIGVLQGDLGLDAAVAENYRTMVEALHDLGFTTVPVDLSTLEYVVPAYYTIATAEASTNLARYNGIRYGYRPDWAENPEELMRKARSEAFGPEVQLRILLGTYVLRSGFQDQYYTRAQKIRTLIRQELAAVYQNVSMILMPVFPVQAFAHAHTESSVPALDPFQQKVADRFTCTANLAAVPSLTIPSGLAGGLPVGMQLMGPAFSEEVLFQVARQVSTLFPIQFPPDTMDFATWRAAKGGA
jgi:aspartyl-tRNA(Asn)/glutamyl-tRNA(Gln) amidotransferase subunit A